jgi:4-amino-4-deoxy-L-arabinose transferase-like glycosyltransferase
VGTRAPVFLAYRDSSQFFAAAYDLVQSGQLELPLKRAPMYPLFLAGVIASLGPSLEAVATVQHLLGLGTVLMVYALGAVVFGRGTGLLAALVAGVNGSLVLMEHSVFAEALLTPVLMGSVLALVVGLRGERHGERRVAPTKVGARRRGDGPPNEFGGIHGGNGAPTEAGGMGGWSPVISPSRPLALCVLAGVLLGVGALARPVAQAVLPLFLVAVLLQRRSWRGRAALAGLMLIGFGVVVGPWLVRNRLTHGEGAVSGGLGDSLYARTHRYDEGFTWRDRGEPPADPRRAELRAWVFRNQFKYERGPEFREAMARELGIGDAEADAALREAAVQVIRQEPGRYLWGTAAMFVELGLFYDDPLEEGWWSRSRPGYERAWPRPVREALERAPVPSEADKRPVEWLVGLQDRRVGVLVGVLFLLGTLRCLLAGPRLGLLLPAVAASQILLYVALDGPHYRYRYPLQPLITLVACGGLTWLIARGLVWRRRPRGQGISALGKPLLVE